MLLFWMPDGTAELTAGSHNWTKRAPPGLNVEASLVVRATQTSPLVAAAADYLARMQAIAEPFDLAKVDVYRQLQRRTATGLTPVMEPEAEDGGSASGSIITVLGTDRKDLTKLGTVRREIHGALLDPKVRRAVRLPRHHPAFGIAARVSRRRGRHLVRAAPACVSAWAATTHAAPVGQGGCGGAERRGVLRHGASGGVAAGGARGGAPAEGGEVGGGGGGGG